MAQLILGSGNDFLLYNVSRQLPLAIVSQTYVGRKFYAFRQIALLLTAKS